MIYMLVRKRRNVGKSFEASLKATVMNLFSCSIQVCKVKTYNFSAFKEIF